MNIQSPSTRLRRFVLAAVLGSNCGLSAPPVGAEIVVVVHPDSPVQSMTARELADLYLGRSRLLGYQDPATVFDQPGDSPLRERFFRGVVGIDLRRANAYWARLQFSGDVQPPVPLADSRHVVDAVSRNRLAIGYIDAAAADKSVRVVFRFDER